MINVGAFNDVSGYVSYPNHTIHTRIMPSLELLFYGLHSCDFFDSGTCHADNEALNVVLVLADGRTCSSWEYRVSSSNICISTIVGY